jgi:hypothetical protein
MSANPPPPAPVVQWFELIEPERWGTLSKPTGQPQWGTLGKCGWTGVGTKPPGC